jgi:ubiquinone/menaquinone biosynthesis C-methylase UbiE
MPTLSDGGAGPLGDQADAGRRHRQDEEIKASTLAVWGASPAGTAHIEEGLDGSQVAFDQARAARSSRELPWIAELIPFANMRGRDVLEVGCGAGFDAYEFVRHGARYVGSDLVPSNIELTARHLSQHGFAPTLTVADAEQLPFADRSFDVVFSNGVLHHTPDITRALSEVNRVLRPGGEFFVSLYHRTSVFYWLTLFLEHYVLRGEFLQHRTFRDRVAAIEYTSSTARPLVNTYTSGDVRRILLASGFEVGDVWIRKLAVEDLPTLPILRVVWPRVPKSVFDAVGRRFGWYVIARATRRD